MQDSQAGNQDTKQLELSLMANTATRVKNILLRLKEHSQVCKCCKEVLGNDPKVDEELK